MRSVVQSTLFLFFFFFHFLELPSLVGDGYKMRILHNTHTSNLTLVGDRSGTDPSHETADHERASALGKASRIQRWPFPDGGQHHLG